MLISGLGGDSFIEGHNHCTIGWKQFEYQAASHQMSSSKSTSDNFECIAETLVLQVLVLTVFVLGFLG